MTDKTAAFSAMVERHSDLIWHICSDYSLSAAWEVEDAFQEVMCVLWRDYEQFDRRSNERTWVYRVATNTMLMLKRKKSNQPQPLVEKIPDTPSPDTENYRLLLQLIDQLNDTDARIIRAHLDGFHNYEIAQMTGLSLATVTRRLAKAKHLLRKQYSQQI